MDGLQRRGGIRGSARAFGLTGQAVADEVLSSARGDSGDRVDSMKRHTPAGRGFSRPPGFGAMMITEQGEVAARVEALRLRAKGSSSFPVASPRSGSSGNHPWRCGGFPIGVAAVHFAKRNLDGIYFHDRARVANGPWKGYKTGHMDGIQSPTQGDRAHD